METKCHKDKNYFNDKIEKLIDLSGKIISYQYDSPGIAGNSKYPVHRLDKTHFLNLKKWYADVRLLLIEMNEEEKKSALGRIIITSSDIDTGVLLENVEKIRTMLMNLKESIEQ